MYNVIIRLVGHFSSPPPLRRTHALLGILSICSALVCVCIICIADDRIERGGGFCVCVCVSVQIV